MFQYINHLTRARARASAKCDFFFPKQKEYIKL